jgi:hypothetical protein
MKKYTIFSPLRNLSTIKEEQASRMGAKVEVVTRDIDRIKGGNEMFSGVLLHVLFGNETNSKFQNIRSSAQQYIQKIQPKNIAIKEQLLLQIEVTLTIIEITVDSEPEGGSKNFVLSLLQETEGVAEIEGRFYRDDGVLILDENGNSHVHNLVVRADSTYVDVELGNP